MGFPIVPGCGKVTRRHLLAYQAGAALITFVRGRNMFSRDNLLPITEALDHLLLGTSDLDQGILLVKEMTGLTPGMGGSHPGVGTRNALLSLGKQYLEIIAPDPAQVSFSYRTDLRKLGEPRLIAWAALSRNIDAAALKARGAGMEVFGPSDGSRKKPDGKILTWRVLGIQNSLGNSTVDPVPFFIQWGEGVPHPSQDSVTDCRLESLGFEHPEPEKLRALLRKLGFNADVKRAAAARLTASIRTPKGLWTLS